MDLHLRSEWTARAVPTGTPSRDVGAVFVHHEGGGRRGNPSDKAAVLREIEGYVLGKGYAAIDYNVMVFQDGSVWEGRGYPHEDAATLNWNSRSVSICAVGNFEIEDPTDQLLTGIAQAIQLADLDNWLAPGAQVLGHRDSGFSTSCPGSRLYARMDTIRARAAGSIRPTGPTPEELAALARAMEEQDMEHGQAVDTVCAAGGRIITLSRGGELAGQAPGGAAIEIIGTGYWPNKDAARRIVLKPNCLTDENAPLRGWVMDLNGGLHGFAEAGQSPPANRKAAYYAGGKVLDFNER